NPLPANAELREASIYETGLSTESADVVTARQVFHNLSDIDGAVQELGRVVKQGGKLIICEYVAVDDAVKEFEGPIFQTKEEGRHLWTGEEMARVIGRPWFANYPDATVELHYAVMQQYSVRDWMARSSLAPEVQEQIVARYVQAPADVKERMHITVTKDGDALVDRPFAFIVAQKPKLYDEQAA
ncbi:MAG: methyltransferase domain-containing protein, partial [Patescibacteria group bacterium]|nr:methyltransferase domain-containing protein [Patescibacteria group bacterium]